MGKNKKGKKGDAEKKAALQARKEAKASKTANKRLAKEARALGQQVDADLLLVSDNNKNASVDGGGQIVLEDLLEQYRKHDEQQQVTSSRVESLEGFPPARANATLTLTEDTKKRNAELYLFGGEYYDGAENVVLDQLFRFDLNKQEWKRIVTPSPQPPPRCSHSTVYYNGCLYVFAGEMATLHDYHHYKDLWKFDIKKQIWTDLSKTTTASVAGGRGTLPTARSGHAAAVWKHFMVVFGGFSEALRTSARWYNDVTVFNLQTEQWLDIPHSKLATRPEPRSACNVAVIQDDMIVHGGFSKLQLDKKKKDQQTSGGGDGGSTNNTVSLSSETKVHTDAWMLHLKPLLKGKPPTWERLTNSLPRSQLPGFVKHGNEKKKASASANTIARRHPCGRSGTASIAYKDRMLVYGGVVDTEQHHHKVDSVFYNDLFALDIERKKWFPIHAKKKSSSSNNSGDGHQRRQKEEVANEDDADDGDDRRKVDETKAEKTKTNEQDEAENSDLEEEEDVDDMNEHLHEHEGWDVDKLRSNMFAFIDGNGNLVYEKIVEEDEEKDAAGHKRSNYDDDSEEKEEEKEADEEKEEEKDEEKEEEKEEPRAMSSSGASQKKTDPDVVHSRVVTSSSVMKLNPETKVPEAVVGAEPLPRIKAALILSGHTLYIYGGLLEVGDREVTLDDLWSFDLRKRERWHCLHAGSMHHQVWRGAVFDDDDSYISTGQSALDQDDDDSDMDDDEEDDWNENEDDDDDAARKEKQDDRKKKSKRSGLREEIAELNEKYGLSDANRTPEPSEALAEFYSRTSAYWNEEAAAKVAASASSEALSSKELKREGFNLAQERYRELEPIMERLRELDLQREAKKEKKKEKKEKKKESSKKSRRDR